MSSPNNGAPFAKAVSSSEVASLPASNANRPRVDPPLLLPTGEVIDGKNTLQSFATTPPNVPTSPRDLTTSEAIGGDVPPTLPNGQVITGKNTLQSFDAIPERTFAKTGADSSVVAPSTTVVAIGIPEDPPEEPHIVFAELAPLEPSPPPTLPWYKGRPIWVLLTIVAIVIAVGLGAYIGTSANSNSASDSGAMDLNTSPQSPVAPFMTIPTPTTTTPIATVIPIVTAPSPTVAINSPVISPMASPNMDNPTAIPTVTAPLAPSSTPTTFRTEALTSYINNITLSNQILLSNGTSPESQALAWLIANDTSLNTTALATVSRQDGALFASIIGFSIRQRYALLTMWFQQNETLQWSRTDGWLTDLDECNWYGIFCDDVMDTGNAVKAITSVRINGTRSYVGVIPAEVGLLSNLLHFEIRNTYDSDTKTAYFIGTLPDSIGRWTALTYFYVGGNALTGQLPDSIGQWPALTYFDVFINALTGSLPDSIGSWTALTSFDVSFNALNGTLPESIGQWTALTYFDVYDNALIGSLPDSIGEWTALTYFDVSANFGLTGTLPESIGQWTALTFFYVLSNNFNGTIPVSVGNWSLIEKASFAGNQLIGTMPIAICQYIDPDTDFLDVDCTVNCTCCTVDCSVE